MNKYVKQLLSIILLLVASISLVSAQNHIMDAGSIDIDFVEKGNFTLKENKFGKDYFFGGESIDFSGAADDVYLFANNIDFNGKTSGSFTAFANDVEVNGVVGKNFHSGASSVEINGHVLETAFIGASKIVIGPDAIIDGTLLAGSKTLLITGTLNNGLLAGAGEVIIDGPVKGNVNIKTGKLIITERGSISGNLTYDSKVEISAKERSRVSGQVKYEVSEKNVRENMSAFAIVACILFFLAIGVSGLLLLLLPGVKTLYKKKREGKVFGKTLLWGLIPLFTFPVIIIITIPLFPLSIALALAAFPLMGLATVLGLTLAGQFLFSLLKWKKDNIYLQFLFAFAVFIILGLIPFVKVLVCIAVAALGAGLLINKVFKTDF